MSSGNEQAIRERAYAIWEEEGCPWNRDLDHWLRAEAEIIASAGDQISGHGDVTAKTSQGVAPILRREGRLVDAYVDESGAKGLLRNLDPSVDDKIAVIAAIAVPRDDVERFRITLAMPFDWFKAARPPGNNSLHITDAFKSGNEHWADVARDVRAEIFGQIRALEIPVIYDARRLRVVQESFIRLDTLVNQGREQRQSDIKVGYRPSAERIEEQCMIGLALKLDALAEDYGFGTIDLMTDQIDRPIAEIYKQVIDRTRNISNPPEHITHGWDPNAQEKVSGSIRMSITDVRGNRINWLDSKHVGDLVVLGKDDPFVFAADVVVNALHYHLSGLAVVAPLNAPSSINGWELSGRVYGVRDNAIEDLI